MHPTIYADLETTADGFVRIERSYQGKSQVPRKVDIKEHFLPSLLLARRLVLDVKPHASLKAGVAR